MFVKQKPAYGVRISDWSSDVCSSYLALRGQCVEDRRRIARVTVAADEFGTERFFGDDHDVELAVAAGARREHARHRVRIRARERRTATRKVCTKQLLGPARIEGLVELWLFELVAAQRSEEVGRPVVCQLVGGTISEAFQRIGTHPERKGHDTPKGQAE